jgi:hypothetical protein
MEEGKLVVHVWTLPMGQEASFSPPEGAQVRGSRQRHAVVVPAGAGLVSTPDRGVMLSLDGTAGGRLLGAADVHGAAQKGLAGWSFRGAPVSTRVGPTSTERG